MMFLNVLLLTLIVSVSGKTDYDKERRYFHQTRQGLLKDYPRKAAPAKRVQVDVNFFLLYVKNLDVNSQTLTLYAAMDFRWRDPLLVWNESGSSDPLFMERSDIWTPDILIMNNDQQEDLHPASNGIRVYANGNVVMTVLGLIQTQCYIDVTRYPFDHQLCKLSFIPWLFNYSEPQIIRLAQGKEMGKSVEWEMVNMSAGFEDAPEVEIMNVAVIDFHLKRKYMFYLLTVIVPVYLLSVMNACVFLLPVESGENISYLISILVSYSVFINYINEVMPKSGTPSRLGIYLVLVLCESCAAILVTLGVLNYHYKRKPKEQGEKGVRKIDMKEKQEEEKTKGAIAVKTKRIEHSVERFFFLIFIIFALLSPTIFFI